MKIFYFIIAGVLVLQGCGKTAKSEGCTGASCTESAAVSAPVVSTDPTPAPTPSPSQTPTPAPTPSPVPAPVPTPSPTPTPTPVQTPVQNPSPAPVPAPAPPAPTPTPSTPTYTFPAYNAAWGLTRSVYDKAVAWYANPPVPVTNLRYMTVIDFYQNSTQKRLYLFDLETGTVEQHLVTHGSGSDPNNTTYATLFSNQIGSDKTALGLYITLATYMGEHGYSLRLRGLEATNNNAEVRDIVMHPAPYVQESADRAGRSWGCAALDPTISQYVIDDVKDGSLLLMDGPSSATAKK